MKRMLLIIVLCLALPAGALGFSPPAHESDHTWNGFGYCERLTDVTLPASVTHIDAEAFQGCPFAP